MNLRQTIKMQAKGDLFSRFLFFILTTLFLLVALNAPDLVISRALPPVDTERLNELAYGGDLNAMLGYARELYENVNIPPIAVAAAVIYALMMQALQVGYFSLCLKKTRGEAVAFSDIFAGFSYFFRAIFMRIIKTFIIYIGFCLFFVPGIVFALMYSQADFCLAEDPALSPIGALRKSRRLMKNRKTDFLIFRLSFILWDLLCAFTTGILQLFVTPYVTLSRARYYNELR